MNATLISSNFRLLGAKRDIALEHLQQWAREYTEEVPIERRNVPGAKKIASCETDLTETLSILGWDTICNKAGDILGLEQHNCENVSGGYESAMSKIAGCVEPGSYLIFHRADNNIVRWSWSLAIFSVDTTGRSIFKDERRAIEDAIRIISKARALAQFHISKNLSKGPTGVIHELQGWEQEVYDTGRDILDRLKDLE